MLIYRRTSILESPAQTLVNTVNCVGVMGKGLAHAFKEREPSMFKVYKRICDEGQLEPGKLWLWRGDSGWVLNFPTKKHWRQPSQLEWIEQGLQKFVSAYDAQGITETSFPRLGCGNGGLEWDDVRPLMEQYLSHIPIPVYIHDYTVDVGVPEHLELVAESLRAESLGDQSFDTFLRLVKRVVELSDGKFINLGTDDAFQAHIRGNHELALETETATCLLAEDDLRGVWLGLQNGLVTERQAGWSAREGGRSLISLLSVLPHIRAVQIQRVGVSTPEFALEPCPALHNVATARQPQKQHELAWH
jgi:O-acetyl-ADP-ribose deacetylase (regulator of RNase III)